jgi:hypothetical protein
MFASAEALVAALRRLRAAGYKRVEAYTPWPVEEAATLLTNKRSPVPLIMLLTGIAGAIGAFLLQVWATNDYPVNVGGRPIFSWPAFVPVTFELTVLTASFCGLAALLVVTRLPRLDHPMFAHREFERASQDAFFVRVLSDDPHFDPRATPALLRELGAESVEEGVA